MSSLVGGAASEARFVLGVAVGMALSEALAPEATRLGQEAWSHDSTRAVDAGTAAAIVAEDVEQHGWGEAEAAQHGIDSERFGAIVNEVLSAPGIGELFECYRRGLIDDDGFRHGLRKAKLETRWDAPLQALKERRLDPSVIATAIQRGIVHDPGLLPVGPPTGEGRVPPMPVADIDALDEAAAHGWDRERLAAMTRIVGLPPAPGELLQLVNRGTIGETDYLRGIAEGNTRNEWAPFLLTLRRRLLTPHEYAELSLRGWIDTPAMHAGAALHGLDQADTDLLFKLLGRPIPVHQVTTGLARGGAYNGDHSHVPEAYIRSLQQGNQRPEWYALSYANRYTLPSAFVLRSLLSSGTLTADEGAALFEQTGWPPDLARKVADHAAAGTGPTVDKHVASAATSLISTLRKSYVEDESDDAVAVEHLTAAGVQGDAQSAVLALWARERELVRRTLTPTQIRKAYRETRFTRDEAVARLERLGYNPADAGTLLDE